MQALGTRIAELTGAITKETAALNKIQGKASVGGGGGAAGDGGGMASLSSKLVSPMLLIGAKIAAVLGPLALLGSAVDSATSGLHPFISAVKITGTILGGLLMPSFVAMTGAAYALALFLDGELTPGLEEFYKRGIQNAQTGLELLEEQITTITDLFKALGLTTKDLMGMMGGIAANIPKEILRGGIGGVGGALAGKPNEKQLPGGAVDTGKQIILPPGAAGDRVAQQMEQAQARKGFMANTIEGMRAAVQAMRQAVGGPASYTSGEQLYKEATLAGINMNPFEKKLIEIQQRQLDLMERAIGKLGDGIKPPLIF